MPIDTNISRRKRRRSVGVGMEMALGGRFFGETAWEGTSSRRGGGGEEVEWGPLWPPAGGESAREWQG